MMNSMMSSQSKITKTYLNFRVAAYAKKHLELGREHASKLPKHTNRAFLLAVEADTFLTDLETHNFDIFDEKFRKKSYLKLPYRIYKAASNNYY